MVADGGGMGVHVNFWSGLGSYKAIRDEVTTDHCTYIIQKSQAMQC